MGIPNFMAPSQGDPDRSQGICPTRSLARVLLSWRGVMWPPQKLIASALTWRGWNARVIRAGSRVHEALLRRFGRVKAIGGDTLILTTWGRKSGQERSTPLFYAADDDRLLITASFAGSGIPPGWYLNLVAQPQVRAMIGGRTERFVARTLTDVEAETAWPKLLKVYPTFARYRRRAVRKIPVIELRRRPPLALASAGAR